jgi:peptide/nickel transport system permease protein
MQTQQEISPLNVVTAEVIAQPRSNVFATFLRGIRRAITSNGKVAAGSVILAFFILLALVGPIHQGLQTLSHNFGFTLPTVIPLYDPSRTSGLLHIAPSAEHWLGTTTIGQDLFSQLVYGTSGTIFWSLFTGLLVASISVLIGLVGGYFGGIVDEILSLLTNVFLVLPGLPLMIVLAAYFPRGPITVSLVIVATSWAWGARILRAQTMSLRAREFVAASRSSGEHTWRIIFLEIFPNEVGIVAANFVSTTINVVLSWTALEFLGLGAPNSVSWGSMLYWAQNSSALFSGLWWWFVPPGLCIALLGLGLALINFGIDEIADPRLRKEPKTKTIRATQKDGAIQAA